jgi:hypothetical protein
MTGEWEPAGTSRRTNWTSRSPLFWVAWGIDMPGAVRRVGVGLVAAVVTLVGLPAAASARMEPEGTGRNASSIAMIATTSLEG